MIRGGSEAQWLCHLTDTNCARCPVTHLSETHAAGLCVCVCQHHTASPEYWEALEYESSDSPDLRGESETCWHVENWYEALSSKNGANMKDRLICWLFSFFFWIGLSVTSSCSFYVSTSLRLCVPEMTTSQTLWVRRLTARPAAATLERINARGKTSARPLTPGSLRPTSPGWFSDWYILLLYVELWHFSLSLVILAV